MPRKKTRVVHCKKEKYDVYIGRGKCPQTGEVGKWGNPFVVGKNGDLETVLKKYRLYVMLTPALRDSLKELDGKVLGCWCKNGPAERKAGKPEKDCHGDVLVELLEKMKRGELEVAR